MFQLIHGLKPLQFPRLSMLLFLAIKMETWLNRQLEIDVTHYGLQYLSMVYRNRLHFVLPVKDSRINLFQYFDCFITTVMKEDACRLFFILLVIRSQKWPF